MPMLNEPKSQTIIESELPQEIFAQDISLGETGKIPDTSAEKPNNEGFNLNEYLASAGSLEARIAQFNATKDMFGEEYRKLYRRPSVSPMQNRVMVDNDDGTGEREYVMFASNNYLSLAGDPRVAQAMLDAVKVYGVGSSGSPLLCGTSAAHVELERNMSDYKGTEETILFSSGYAAQQGWMKALLSKDDVLFMDAYSHASCNEGAMLTGVKRVPFRHNNLEDLERKIKFYRHRRETAWIFVEGVYSMHGDSVDLKKVVELAKRYDCKIALDDAHGVGVLGKNGTGVPEACGVDPEDITINLGTFSKAFGAVGGYICTSKQYSDYIRYLGKSHMFSASIPPSVCMAINEAINIARAEPERAEKLRENVNYLVERLGSIGIETSTESAIVPMAVPMGANAREMAIEYANHGIYINMVSYPAVPLDQQRFRATVIYSHTKEDIDKLVEVTEQVFANAVKSVNA